MDFRSPDLLFEQRLAHWDGRETLELRRPDRKGAPRAWYIWVDGDRFHVQHGLLGGALQQTDTQGREKNKGRSNYISAERDALAEARREALKRYDYDGYCQYVDNVNIDGDVEALLADGSVSSDAIVRLLVQLRGCFNVWKPSNNLFDQKKLLKLAEAGGAWYSEKRDGLCYLIVIDPHGQVVFYSRRARPYMDKEGPVMSLDGIFDYSVAVPWAARFPHLVEEVKSLGLPPATMLAGELYIHGPNGRDSFKQVISYTKSLTPQSLADQAAHGLPSLYLWDAIFWGGQDLASTVPIGQRWQLLEKTCEKLPLNSYLEPLVWCQFGSPQEALEAARLNHIEGYVVVDPNAVFGDRAWNLRGKPDRPALTGKLKPKQEDDFILFWDPEKKWGTWGEGRHEAGKLVTLPNGQQVVHGGVGSVGLFQYNQNGELVYVCDCASGMDYEFQAQLRKEHFPFVAQIEFAERTYENEGDATNALRFPVYLRPRPDKAPEECINPRL